MFQLNTNSDTSKVDKIQMNIINKTGKRNEQQRQDIILTNKLFEVYHMTLHGTRFLIHCGKIR